MFSLFDRTGKVDLVLRESTEHNYRASETCRGKTSESTRFDLGWSTPYDMNSM